MEALIGMVAQVPEARRGCSRKTRSILRKKKTAGAVHLQIVMMLFRIHTEPFQMRCDSITAIGNNSSKLQVMCASC